jgi:hypothetical protein
MSLVEHARNELQAAGVFNKDSDYDGMLGNAVMELVEVFAKQGHSGFSAETTLQLFDEVARFRNLTPITNNPDEWEKRDELTWQNKRRSTLFSRDGGKTWYDIQDPSLNNGDTWENADE